MRATTASSPEKIGSGGTDQVASPASTPAFADPGLANPISGSVILSLNLPNATKTGTYTGAGAQQYTIAVTAT